METGSARRKLPAVIGSLIFLVVAPGTLAGYVPWAISRWRVLPPFLGFPPIRYLGVLLMCLGAPVLLDSFARFALQGFGTPAPIFPPDRLVVFGWYRYVRNPMYVAVTSLIIGQALLFGDLRVLAYAAVVWLGFHLFVLLYEEPALRSQFRADYERFCAAVPRWVPRLTPWKDLREG